MAKRPQDFKDEEEEPDLQEEDPSWSKFKYHHISGTEEQERDRTLRLQADKEREEKTATLERKRPVEGEEEEEEQRHENETKRTKGDTLKKKVRNDMRPDKPMAKPKKPDEEPMQQTPPSIADEVKANQEIISLATIVLPPKPKGKPDTTPQLYNIRREDTMNPRLRPLNEPDRPTQFGWPEDELYEPIRPLNEPDRPMTLRPQVDIENTFPSRPIREPPRLVASVNLSEPMQEVKKEVKQEEKPSHLCNKPCCDKELKQVQPHECKGSCCDEEKKPEVKPKIKQQPDEGRVMERGEEDQPMQPLVEPKNYRQHRVDVLMDPEQYYSIQNTFARATRFARTALPMAAPPAGSPYIPYIITNAEAYGRTSNKEIDRWNPQTLKLLSPGEQAAVREQHRRAVLMNDMRPAIYATLTPKEIIDTEEARDRYERYRRERNRAEAGFPLRDKTRVNGLYQVTNEADSLFHRLLQDDINKTAWRAGEKAPFPPSTTK